MPTLDWNILKQLCLLHSTPGEEDDVVAFLAKQWEKDHWNLESLGRFAILAKSQQWKDNAPTVLYMAHADSPGFIVQSLSQDGHAGVMVALGGPQFAPHHQTARVLIKSQDKLIPATIRRKKSKHGPTEYPFQALLPVQQGDHACLMPFCAENTGQQFQASFLDNRVGCFLLHQLSSSLAPVCNVILAVTANEEFLGFGADTLAHACNPDLVIALDATYEDAKQKVKLGQGPVLTLSDKSALISSRIWAALKKICGKYNIPIQSEVYNYSGTDARAFPLAGRFCPALPILIPSTGNHSPKETIRKEDVLSLYSLLSILATEQHALMELLKENTFL